MLTLGLSGVYHASSACLVEDGRILGAVEEDRFLKRWDEPGWASFAGNEWPIQSMAWCLNKRKARFSDIDHIAFAWDPRGFTQTPPEDDESLVKSSSHASDRMLAHLWASLAQSRLRAAPDIMQTLAIPNPLPDAKPCHAVWHGVSHQMAHAASAYLTSPFDEAAILCLYARGEKSGTSYATASGFTIDMLGEVAAPHSFGRLYERITRHLGFDLGCGQAQTMTLAAYGHPCLREAFEKIIRMQDNGQYRIQDADLTELLGPPRAPDAPLLQQHKDVACSLQESLNESVLTLASWLQRTTNQRTLALSGGVFRNCVLNTAIRDAGLFDNIWVAPAPGAQATALGAALWIDHAVRKSKGRFSLNHACLGPEFSAEEIEEALLRSRLSFGRPPALAVAVAARLADGKVVAWFQGGMEFGPQSLGGRCILASPADPMMRQTLNSIKGRPDFQPIASAVLADAAADWFEDAKPSPFRSFITLTKSDKAPRIPSAVHVDGTARIQTVDHAVQGLFYDVIEAFGALTGIPVLLSTAFATRGRPIVCTPADAIESYASSAFDTLAIGPFLLEKSR